MAALGRDRKESGLPPTSREGMNPSNMPPYGMIIEPPPAIPRFE
jgi:hypothetical protein